MLTRDDVIAAATDLQGLVNGMKAVDPTLAASLVEKPLAQSKTPWGTLLAGVVTWVSAKYGFGWSPEMCAVVGGAGVLVGSYLMRAISTGPISGIFTKALK